MAGVREVPGNFCGTRTGQFFERGSEVDLEDEFLVVLEVNEKREGTQAGQLFAKKTDVFARRPGVHDIRRPAIRKNARPFAIDLVKAPDRIILCAESGAAVRVF